MKINNHFSVDTGLEGLHGRCCLRLDALVVGCIFVEKRKKKKKEEKMILINYFLKY